MIDNVYLSNKKRSIHHSRSPARKLTPDPVDIRSLHEAKQPSSDLIIGPEHRYPPATNVSRQVGQKSSDSLRSRSSSTDSTTSSNSSYSSQGPMNRPEIVLGPAQPKRRGFKIDTSKNVKAMPAIPKRDSSLSM